MFVQIILLMGLIEVIYNPLTHILHLDSNLISQLINITGQLTGTDITSSSIQMTVVDTIKKSDLLELFLQLQGTLHTSDLQNYIRKYTTDKYEPWGLSLALIPRYFPRDHDIYAEVGREPIGMAYVHGSKSLQSSSGRTK